MKRFVTFATAASALQVRIQKPELDDCADAKSIPEIPSGLVQVKETTNAQQEIAVQGVSFIQRNTRRSLYKPTISPDVVVDDEEEDLGTSFVQFESKF